MFISARKQKEKSPVFTDRYEYSIHLPPIVTAPPWLTHSDFPVDDKPHRAEAKATTLSVGSAVSVDGEEEEEVKSVSSAGTKTTGSILLEAAERGDTAVVRNVLGRKAAPDPDSKTKYQSRSALQLACGYGQIKVVEQLLQVSNVTNRI